MALVALGTEMGASARRAPPVPDPTTMKPQTRQAVFLAAGFALLRGLFLLKAGVAPEAAYFYICGEHPAWGYFDGPAGTALLVRSVAAWGGSVWLFLGPLAGFAASLAAWRLAARLFDPGTATWSLLALNLLPVFNAAAFVPGPLLPALTFSLVGAASVWDASRLQHGGFLGWLVAGIAFAGASLFAYWSALFALACLLVPFSRRVARKPAAIFGAVVAGVLTFSALYPSWLWLQTQDGIPIKQWTFTSLTQWNFFSLGIGVADLLLGLSPILGIALIFAFVSGCRRSRGHPAEAFAIAAALPGLLLGALWMYRGWEASQMALPSAAILLAPSCRMLPRWMLMLALALAAALTVPIWLTQPREAARAREAANIVLTLDEKLAPDLEGGIFLIAEDAPLASALGYYLRNDFIAPSGQPRVFAAASQDQSDQFSLWGSYDQFIETDEPPNEFFTEVKAVNPFIGHPALYVGTEPPENLPTKIRSAFSEVQLVREVGTGEDRLLIYLCLDYQTLPL